MYLLQKFKVTDFTEKEIAEFKNYVDCKRIMISPETAIAHYHTKKALGEKLGTTPEAIKFKYNQHGKPYISDNLFFSITHTGNYVFIAIDTSEIAIDAEIIKPFNKKLIERIASNDDLKSFNRENSDIEFFKLWTLKEAYFKLIGTGITNFKSLNASEILAQNSVEIKVCEDYVLTIIEGR